MLNAAEAAMAPRFPASPLTSRLNTAETLLWCSLALAVVFLNLAPGHEPWFAQDTYQYLSVAHNLASTGHADTSIVHFDMERRHGTVPAPATTFPPGYPVLIAGLSRLGIPDDRAASAIAILSFIGVIPLLVSLCVSVDLGKTATRAVLLLWVLNAEATGASASLVTETPFTFFSIAALALLASSSRPLSLYAGMAAAGLSYHIRYAGLFLVLAVAVLAALRVVIGRRAKTGAANVHLATSTALMLAIVAAGFARNSLLTGNWRGGNEKKVFNGLGATVKTLVTSVYHVLFGSNPPSHFKIFAILAGISVLLMAATVLKSRLVLPPSITAAAVTSPLSLLILYAGVYTAAITYAGLTTVISFGARMFVPLVPVLLILICRALQDLLEHQSDPLLKRVAVLSCVLLFIAYGGENVASERESHAPSPHTVVAKRLAVPLSTPPSANSSMREWIVAHIPPREPLMAADGQATAYVLHHSTISVLGRWFSGKQWDAGYVHSLLRQFGSSHILVYTGAGGDEPDEEKDWPFFESLLHATPPAWLKMEAQSRDAKLFVCTDCPAKLAAQ